MLKDYYFTVKLSSVAIPKLFATTYPKEEKIDSVREYFDINGELDKPITVRLSNSGTPILTNGYIRYLVAFENNLEEIPVYIEQNSEPSKHKCLAAKFPGNKKTYYWKIPKGMKVSAGDKVLVNARQGCELVTAKKIVITDFPAAKWAIAVVEKSTGKKA